MVPQFRRSASGTVSWKSSHDCTDPLITSTEAAHLYLCILKARIVLTQFQPRRPQSLTYRSRTYTVAALVCMILLALLAVAQVAHTHQGVDNADHCPLCIVMHSAAPVAAAAAIVALVQVAITVPVLEVQRVTRNWRAQLFIRPPPTGR